MKNPNIGLVLLVISAIIYGSTLIAGLHSCLELLGYKLGS